MRMSTLSFAEIENALLPYRKTRRSIQSIILNFALSSEAIRDPFLFLNRMFVRLKSADSIVEKINRKQLPVSSIADLRMLVTDVLGMRVIVSNLMELGAIDNFVSRNFEIRSRKDLVHRPNEFGYRTIEYALTCHDPEQDADIPFEIQLRTIYQPIE